MKLLDDSRDELGQYIREMADLMGLRDWHLIIADDPLIDDPDANARVSVVFGQKRASIEFPPDWAERDADGFRRTICHELVHCHLWSMEQRVDDLCGVLGSAAYMVASNAMKEAHELATDGIASAWAETLPLPIRSEAKEAA